MPSLAPEGIVSAYTSIQRLVALLSEHNAAFVEYAPITVYNASDKELAQTLPHGNYIAFKTAVKLKKYGLNVTTVTNASIVTT